MFSLIKFGNKIYLVGPGAVVPVKDYFHAIQLAYELCKHPALKVYIK